MIFDPQFYVFHQMGLLCSCLGKGEFRRHRKGSYRQPAGGISLAKLTCFNFVSIFQIVYPFGITIDFPNKHVYWVDSFLAHIERVDYDGSNRKTLKKGAKV
jgi:hypothetical protein